MKKNIILTLIIVILVFLIFLSSQKKVATTISPLSPNRIMEFKSIDTMKYSRDPSREKLNDPSFDDLINKQTANIAKTGATHIAIATPYDEEFLPILKRWVAAARKNNLKVWFRGNWSGWEQWFDYDSINRTIHIEKTKAFILNNPELFEDGDVFTACPECENGGPGDPRRTGDINGFRKFMIDEYSVTKNAFSKINKNVSSNFDSMNADVAKKIMDKNTTKSMDGIVVIDHYVSSPDQLVFDIQQISIASGGRIVLGEFGVPIPDLNGDMTEEEQANWIEKALSKLITMKEVKGVNYWVNTGGSTQLWDEKGNERKSVSVITKYYHINTR